jgi:hypothetical protein
MCGTPSERLEHRRPLCGAVLRDPLATDGLSLLDKKRAASFRSGASLVSFLSSDRLSSCMVPDAAMTCP